MAEKTFFSLPAAARELGVSTDVLRRQYRSGLIAAIKTPGGQPRFTTETIELIKQNGWPQAAPSENEIHSVPKPASQEAVSDAEFPNSRAAPLAQSIRRSLISERCKASRCAPAKNQERAESKISSISIRGGSITHSICFPMAHS